MQPQMQLRRSRLVRGKDGELGLCFVGLTFVSLTRNLEPGMSVPEMPYSREDHRQSMAVGGIDHLLITD